MVWAPLTLGVNVTEQVAAAPLPLSVHGLSVKVPAKLLVQLTSPVGMLFVPALVSVTVAVHVVAFSTGTGFGVQVTVVLVARLVTVSVAVPLLRLCVGSPP